MHSHCVHSKVVSCWETCSSPWDRMRCFTCNINSLGFARLWCAMQGLVTFFFFFLIIQRSCHDLSATPSIFFSQGMSVARSHGDPRLFCLFWCKKTMQPGCCSLGVPGISDLEMWGKKKWTRKQKKKEKLWSQTLPTHNQQGMSFRRLAPRLTVSGRPRSAFLGFSDAFLPFQSEWNLCFEPKPAISGVFRWESVVDGAVCFVEKHVIIGLELSKLLFVAMQGRWMYSRPVSHGDRF